ncbi:MAG TPA: hypothetical protein VKU41_18100 [Polyangiaceae bacterium]|nr:hypothetical protein [Polyangiaceae bacterium]
MLAAKALAALFRSANPEAPEDPQAVAGAYLLVMRFGLAAEGSDA